MIHLTLAKLLEIEFANVCVNWNAEKLACLLDFFNYGLFFFLNVDIGGERGEKFFVFLGFTVFFHEELLLQSHYVATDFHKH